MEKKELPKQQRRKRKDPQSRDFYCKCGKGYLSYAAVYTHVKNKHDSNKEFEEGIIKPQKEKLKRGRPKDKKQIIMNPQTQSLSIIQQTILQIYQKLKSSQSPQFQNIILEGNQEADIKKFDQSYQKLSKKNNIQINLLKSLSFGKIQEKINEHHEDFSLDQQDLLLLQRFINGVNKHFSSNVSARVAYVINYLVQAVLKESINIYQKNDMIQKIQELKSKISIWQQENSGQENKDLDLDFQINMLLYDAMIKWLRSLKKQEIQQYEQ